METVTVVHPNDPEQRMTINADAYDPKRHKLWSEREAAPHPPVAHEAKGKGGKK